MCSQVGGTVPNQLLQSRVHQLSDYVGPSLYRPVMPQVRPRRVGNQSHSLNGHLGIQVLHTMRHHRSSPSVAQVRCTAVCTVRRHVAHKVGHHRSPHLAATMLRQVTPHVAGYLWTRVVPHAAEQAAIHLAPRVVHTLLRKVAAHVSDRIATHHVADVAADSVCRVAVDRVGRVAVDRAAHVATDVAPAWRTT